MVSGVISQSGGDLVELLDHVQRQIDKDPFPSAEFAGPAAYAASIGLAIGALATPQGSVATMIATDIAGPDAPPLPMRRLAPLAAAAVLIATLLLWTTL